jgi:hypothetical protein
MDLGINIDSGIVNDVTESLWNNQAGLLLLWKIFVGIVLHLIQQDVFQDAFHTPRAIDIFKRFVVYVLEIFKSRFKSCPRFGSILRYTAKQLPHFKDSELQHR